MQGIFAFFFFQQHLRLRTTILEVLLKIRSVTYVYQEKRVRTCWGKYVPKKKLHGLLYVLTVSYWPSHKEETPRETQPSYTAQPYTAEGIRNWGVVVLKLVWNTPPTFSKDTVAVATTSDS